MSERYAAMEHLRLWFESPVLFQPGDILCLLFLQYDIEDLDKNGLGSNSDRGRPYWASYSVNTY